MIDIIDELNLKGILEHDWLGSFDITNMFPSIDNEVSMQRVRSKLLEHESELDVPVDCVMEALEICLKRNCSTYDGDSDGSEKCMFLCRYCDKGH